MNEEMRRKREEYLAQSRVLIDSLAEGVDFVQPHQRVSIPLADVLSIQQVAISAVHAAESGNGPRFRWDYLAAAAAVLEQAVEGAYPGLLAEHGEYIEMDTRTGQVHATDDSQENLRMAADLNHKAKKVAQNEGGGPHGPDCTCDDDAPIIDDEVAARVAQAIKDALEGGNDGPKTEPGGYL